MLTDPAILHQHRMFARKTLFAYSLMAITLLPIYQIFELLSIGGTTPLWWSNAAWRAIVVVEAITSLIWLLKHRDGYGAPLMLRLLACSLMVMIFGLLVSNYLSAEGNVALMVNGLIIVIFASSLACLRGAKELLLIYGPPLIVTLVFFVWLRDSLELAFSILFSAFIALSIAMLISELLARTRMDLFKQQTELRNFAVTDALTGLNNRHYLEPHLQSEIARAQRHGKTFSLVIADLDRFKRVNDEHGHNVGDAVLKILAKRICQSIRDEDCAVRWGGEEFLILMPEVNSQQAFHAAERVRHAVGVTPFETNGLQLSITISLGVAEYGGEEDSVSLIARADKALYRAKEEGRNRVCIECNGGP